MNYNQLQFWLLFLAVIVPYWWLPHRKQNALLLVASYVFYGFWDYRFLFLILLTTIIDYIGGLGVAGARLSRASRTQLAILLVVSAILLTGNVRYGELAAGIGAGDAAAILDALPRSLSACWIPIATAAVIGSYMFLLPKLYELPEVTRRRTFLVISMVANLGILGFFKYFDFFVESFADLLRDFGFHPSIPVLSIVLPAGISFYTFQAMSYTIDIYRGKTEPTRSFSDFALFVCFFPHLVAGPIMRAHTLLPQVVHPRSAGIAEFREGLALVLVGLFKKLVVADNMAPIANSVFMRLADGTTGDLSGSEVLVGIYAFAFQIYGDFSGYSSIARGISKWLGFDLVINFHNPYLAVTPSDFWKRWHISLSSWLRDYLYIPLGGNRDGAGGRVPQPDHYDAARRPVAWRELDLRRLGPVPRPHPVRLPHRRCSRSRQVDRTREMGDPGFHHVPPHLHRVAVVPGRQLRCGRQRAGRAGEPVELHGVCRHGHAGDRVLRRDPVRGRVAHRRGEAAAPPVPRALARAGRLVSLPGPHDRDLLFAREL